MSGNDDHRVVALGRWTEFVLFGTGEDARIAPLTRRLVAECAPEAVTLARKGGGEVIFSRLAPRTHIRSHCGPTDLRWTAHLPLRVPKAKGCRIRVGHRWHEWQLGKVLLFDDSFEHKVCNDTNEERIVLLLRFWHPGLDLSHRSACLDDARRLKGEAVDKRYHPAP